ncbi:MAG: ribose 5-phosphate isomerase A [Phycisphaerales bacterium]|nr:ribose 5-phosphate isomerase A [Phycisphaerales bacterium]
MSEQQGQQDMTDTLVDELALAAISSVQSGMKVGLGAGRTAARGIKLLAQRVTNEGLDIQCVAASERAEDLAREHGLKIVDFAMLEELDILIDGADAVDRKMQVMKGSRGAMTRERILCWAAKQTVFMVNSNKVAEDQIGTDTPLPIAVMAFGLVSTRKALRHIGINGVIRQDMNGQLFITDNGNLVLDATLNGNENLAQLATELNDIPGVIDHGLFIDEADTIFIENENAEIEQINRSSL